MPRSRPAASIRPNISIITPSLNQAAHLERTICSVLDQHYDNLEYIVIDGGSTDGSVEIIKRYARYLAFWVSERDNGQAEAINKGIRRATGDIVAYLNGDDVYLPGTLWLVALAYGQSRSGARPARWFCGSDEHVREDGSLVRRFHPTEALVDRYLGDRALCAVSQSLEVVQPACFWERSLFDQHGYFREDLHYLFDSEFIARLLIAGERPAVIDATLVRVLLHPHSKMGRGREPFNREAQQLYPIFAPSLTWRERRRARFLERMREARLSSPGALRPSTAPFRHPFAFLRAVGDKLSGRGWRGDRLPDPS